MRTLIDESPRTADVLTSAVLRPTARGDAPSADAAKGLLLRLMERFALLGFALYHLPLFLNNYPSLGGGGMKERGLAISWGHVFTPPGIWVAHHILHVAGPMPNGYRGDNGDVAEEFGRLLIARSEERR